MELIETLITGIAKIIWKAFLLCIYGISKLAEIILKQINDFLKDTIK
ncbi:MAG: hypothetical protein HY840_08815 [Bacteroidetes bacterium]|nr:hypothetical protein [Bacteroidota bacterium]